MRAVSKDTDMNAEQILAGSGYGRECLHSVSPLSTVMRTVVLHGRGLEALSVRYVGSPSRLRKKSSPSEKGLPSAAKAVFKTMHVPQR